ncbi:alpha-galactosidase, partial [Bacteroidota bacterium]
MNVGCIMETQEVVLKNQYINRTFTISENNFYTSGYTDLRTGHNYAGINSLEFSFTLNESEITGRSPFLVVSKPVLSNREDHQKLEVQISGRPGSILDKIEITLNYQLYNNSSTIRKWIEIVNKRESDLEIQNLYWEDLIINPGNYSGVDIYGEYGRVWKKPPFTGGKDDPAILVMGSEGQFILGNESPGMMKQTHVFQETERIAIGLTNQQDKYAFRRVMKGNESFTSPKSFIILCKRKAPEVLFEEDLGEFIRKHMGVKLFKRDAPPLFMYNTWNPFRINIDEKMIMDIADALEGTGVEYLIIDDGWQDFNGDWNVHKEKFPNGLKPVSDYIRSKGMKPGCWISLTIAQKESEAFNIYKDFAVKDIDENPANLHGWSNNFNILTMNIVSPWYEIIKEKVFKLVRNQGMRYLKIDLAMVKSAYIMEQERSGTHDATNLYSGREDFLLKSFERINVLFDSMAIEFPDLIIDCTFELWG